jgi:hypothetical protein
MTGLDKLQPGKQPLHLLTGAELHPAKPRAAAPPAVRRRGIRRGQQVVDEHA